MFLQTEKSERKRKIKQIPGLHQRNDKISFKKSMDESRLSMLQHFSYQQEYWEVSCRPKDILLSLWLQ